MESSYIWLYTQINFFIQSVCEKLPDKDEFHVPIYYTIADLHNNFCNIAGKQQHIIGLPQYDAFHKF